MHLSKSDFKVAQDCPTKLYYKKQDYPSLKDEDEYLQLLAEGGFMVEKIAKLLFPEGREIGFDSSAETAFANTQAALAAENATLFEATLISGSKLARVDILRKLGKEFHLIEVKAKSYDTRENEEQQRKGCRNLFWTKKGGIDSDWQEYLEDVTFQTLVLEELYPGCRVRPFLFMPDKAKTTPIEGLYSMFRLRRVGDEKFRRYLVEFSGDVEQLRQGHFLTQVPVDGEVEYLREDVALKAEQYAASLTPSLRKIVVPLNTDCRKCEYRASEQDVRDGFRECWRELANVQPHILELYRASQISAGNGVRVNDLIQARKVCLFDVAEESLRNRKGELGEWGKRQRMQIEHTRVNTEWISPELRAVVRSWEYPLQFIDFETTALAVPYHAGMRPYEPVAFQWSCHTVANPGAAPVHHEWINVEDVFPNFAFAGSLMREIGTEGTTFCYAPHEKTILGRIRAQMDVRDYRNEELARWLEEMSAKSRLVDMYYDVTLKHYYHPLMKGENSIKAVLEAIWKTNPRLRARFPEYVRDANGQILNPYESLPLLEIQGQPVVVVEGTGAVRAYEAMMYGLEKDDEGTRNRWRQLLLQYCKLDTLAMVILWQHWLERTGMAS